MGKGAHGTRETEVRRNLNKYLEQLRLQTENHTEQTGNHEKLVESYTSFVKTLEIINKHTDRLYTRDEYGRYPSFTKEDQDTLLQEYNSAVTALQAFVAMLGNEGAYDELKNLTATIGALFAKDVSSLTAVSADSRRSLAEIIDGGRVTRVDISGKTPDSVGERYSERKLISFEKDGKLQKGFFTVEDTVRFGEAERNHMKSLAAPLKKMYPQYAALVDPAIDILLDSAGDGMAQGIGMGLSPIFNCFGEAARRSPGVISQKAENQIPQFISMMEDKDLYNSNYNKPGSPEASLKECERLINSCLIRTIRYRAEIGADKDSTISGRNVAMSKAANLFGVSDLLAASEKMELIDENGTVTKGVFMNSALGEDPLKVDADTYKKLPSNACDNPTLLQSAAELQVLDYICGNVDRHGNNFFLQFNQERTQIIGIQGIDNDASFGKIISPDDSDLGQIQVPLNNIRVLSESMGKRLLATDESMLKFSLRDTGLSEAEMQAAADRMAKVKENIRENKIQLISDNEWKSLKLNDLANATKGLNFFRIVRDRVRTLGRDAITADENKQKQFTHGAIADGINEVSLGNDAQRARRFDQQMAASQKKIWGKGSQEFRDLAGMVGKYRERLEGLSDESPTGDFLKVQAMLEEISQQAQKYLRTKEGKRLNKNGAERQKIVQEIKAFADQRLPEFKEALHRRDEIKTEQQNFRMKHLAEKKLEESFNSLWDRLERFVPKDDSRFAEFGKVCVREACTRLGELGNQANLNGNDIREAKALLSHLVAFDIIASERSCLRNQGKKGPGPVEMEFTIESVDNHTYRTHLQESIEANPAFRQTMKNLNRTALRRFMTSGVHQLTLEIAKQTQKTQEAAPGDPTKNTRKEQVSAAKDNSVAPL